MSKILDRLNGKLRLISEAGVHPDSDINNPDWKNPHSPNYDRQAAEDALYHTIGPLLDDAQWVGGEKEAIRYDKTTKKPLPKRVWSSPGEPTPGFKLGGDAPTWTVEEITYAMMGDPNMLFKDMKENPLSPEYGNKGGAPLFRIANRVARHYSRGGDRHLVADLYSNGMVPLMRAMQPGYDEARSPFIAYAVRNIQSAMEHGYGGTQQSKDVTGGEKKNTGFHGVLSSTNPQEIREMANVVKGEFQDVAKHDKHPDNPYGKFSPVFYQLSMQYADAIESGDESYINDIKYQIDEKIEDIKLETNAMPGASTGLGQAVSTPNRLRVRDTERERELDRIGERPISKKTGKPEPLYKKEGIGIGSLDAPGSDEEGMAGNLASQSNEENALIDTEALYQALDESINTNLHELIGKSPKYQRWAEAAKIKPKDGVYPLGGAMTATEFRYVLRAMGPAVANYPGKGMMRAHPEIPRDGRNWWEPGSDPEIEPIPDGFDGPGVKPIGGGKIWHSIWSRGGHQQMGSTPISQEMTEEIREFTKLGIPTARKIKDKVDKRSGKKYQEAVTKVGVNNMLKTSGLKVRIFIDMNKEFGLNDYRQTDRSFDQQHNKKERKEKFNQAAMERQREKERNAEAEAAAEVDNDELELELDDEFAESKRKRQHPIFEEIANRSQLDREIMIEAYEFIASCIDKAINEETQTARVEFKPKPKPIVFAEKTNRMLPVDSMIYEAEEDPLPEDPEDPEAGGEEEAAPEETEKTPDELAAWDATTAMAAAVGNPAKGIP